MDTGRQGRGDQQDPYNQPTDVRVGDSERERALTLLGEHFTAGRLDVEEYDSRCGDAAAARYRSQLDTLFDDLPAPHPEGSAPAEADTSSRPASTVPGRIPRWVPVAVLGAAVLVVLFVIGKGWLLPAVFAFGFFVWRKRG